MIDERRAGRTHGRMSRHLWHESSPVIPEHRRLALEKLIAMNEEVASHHRFAEGYTFSREELYAEREDRWFRNREAK